MTDPKPAPLTEQQLADIEARATAATSGPWGVYVFGGDSLIEIAADLEDTGCGYRARRTVARFEEEPLDNDPAHREWTAEEDWAQVQADADFVAHAPEDVRALLAEIARLKGQRKYLLGQLAKRDAESGRGDEALREFLAGEQPAAEGAQQTATLLVDRTSSTCGACGQPTLASALNHADVSGYAPKRGGGCGATFTAIRSVTGVVGEDDLRSLRPDLPIASS